MAQVALEEERYRDLIQRVKNQVQSLSSFRGVPVEEERRRVGIRLLELEAIEERQMSSRFQSTDSIPVVIEPLEVTELLVNLSVPAESAAMSTNQESSLPSCVPIVEETKKCAAAMCHPVVIAPLEVTEQLVNLLVAAESAAMSTNQESSLPSCVPIVEETKKCAFAICPEPIIMLDLEFKSLETSAILNLSEEVALWSLFTNLDEVEDSENGPYADIVDEKVHTDIYRNEVQLKLI